MEVFGDLTCAGFFQTNPRENLTIFTKRGPSCYRLQDPLPLNGCLLADQRIVAPGIGRLTIYGTNPDGERISFIQLARSNLLSCATDGDAFYGIFQSDTDGGLILNKLRIRKTDKTSVLELLGKEHVSFTKSFSVSRGFILVDGKLYREQIDTGDLVKFEEIEIPDFKCETTSQAALGIITRADGTEGTALFTFDETSHRVTIRPVLEQQNQPPKFEEATQTVDGVIKMYDGSSVVLNLGNGNLWHDGRIHKTGMNVIGATAYGPRLYFMDADTKAMYAWKVGNRERGIGFSFDGERPFFFDRRQNRFTLDHEEFKTCADYAFLCCGTVVTVDKEEFAIYHPIGGPVEHLKCGLSNGCAFIRDLRIRDQFFVLVKPDGRTEMEVYVAKLYLGENPKIRFVPYLACIRSFDAGVEYTAALTYSNGKLEVIVRRRDGGDTIPALTREVKDVDRVFCDDEYVFLYEKKTSKLTAISISTGDESEISGIRGIWSEESVVFQRKKQNGSFDLFVNWPRKDFIAFNLDKPILAAALSHQKLCVWHATDPVHVDIIDLGTWFGNPEQFLREQIMIKCQHELRALSDGVIKKWQDALDKCIERLVSTKEVIRVLSESATETFEHFPHMTTLKEMESYWNEKKLEQNPTEFVGFMLAMPSGTLKLFLKDDVIAAITTNIPKITDEYLILFAGKVAECFEYKPELFENNPELFVQSVVRFVPLILNCLLGVDVSNRNSVRVKKVSSKISPKLEKFKELCGSTQEEAIRDAKIILRVLRSFE